MSPKTVYEKLNSLDWRIVHHKLSQAGYSQKSIMEMQTECLRFLALCATSKKPHAPSYKVDMFWHNAILCTKQYQKDVAKICGGFIHHNPNDGSKKAKSKDENAFWNTIDEYEKVFGSPNLKIWGIKKKVKA